MITKAGLVRASRTGESAAWPDRYSVTMMGRISSLAALSVVATAAWLGAPAATAASSPAGPGSWTVYHGSPAGTGNVAGVASVDTGARAWTSPTLDGEIYGEPLAFDGRVYVATENDTVYALSASTGAVAWSAHLGTPVPSGDLPCGDISPTAGITGTPVIDPSRGEIFVVADELVNGTPAHIFTGLSTASGKTELTQDVDPAGAKPANLLQRTGLTLDDGRVVFGMGGNYGDCSTYRGRVIAVPETGGKPLMFTIDAAPGENQGAVWMGGAAPVVGSNGDVWVATGNGSVYSYSHAYDDSDSVLELSPTMRLLQYFAPSTWATNNSHDLDMSTAPVLLPDGQVILTGKSRIVYLLDGGHLGGIGHQQASLGSACGNDIDGGIALAGMTVYLPCFSGIIAVTAAQSPPALHLDWSSGTGGGPPVLAAGLVWTIGQNGVLYGLNPATGKIRQQAPIGAVANHFPTPSVAGGLMLAPAARDVVAFPVSSTAATARPPASPASPAPTSQAHPGAGGPLGAHGITYLVAGLLVLGGAAWIVWRRRTTG
jgi:polyvinyl alcohol dehydrogenase (cytochrome)